MKKSPRLDAKGRKNYKMKQTNYDEDLTANERKAADLIIVLKGLFDGKPVVSGRDLVVAYRIITILESIGINRSSLAYQEMDRLQRVWKKRQRAQDEIDRN
jgi:hypothetical protein